MNCCCPNESEIAKLQGKRIVLISDSMKNELANIANGFLAQNVEKLWVLTKTENAANAMKHSVDNLMGLMSSAERLAMSSNPVWMTFFATGGYDVVVSSPFERLPLNALATNANEPWDRVLSDNEFRKLVHDRLTHHFRVARTSALVPNCQIVLITLILRLHRHVKNLLWPCCEELATRFHSDLGCRGRAFTDSPSD